MNKLTHLVLLISLSMIVFACKEQVSEREDAVPKVQVKVTKVVDGSIPDYLMLTGKTIYLNKSRIVSPISGYIVTVNVQSGDRIKKGDLLFEIQSPESYLIQQENKSLKTYGFRKVYAPVSGIITSLNVVHKEVFVDKGSEICRIIDSGDLKIQTDLPFEYVDLAKIGALCQVILPDSSMMQGVFSKILPEINEQSQTVKVLTKVVHQTFLPENMMVTIMLEKSAPHQAQLLPKQCLLTDALMSKFWVMKLINDSTAIRVDVVPGNQNNQMVEILEPEFDLGESILLQGAYGLGDTALVEVVH